jgi:Uri superfamily endonuclease
MATNASTSYRNRRSPAAHTVPDCGHGSYALLLHLAEVERIQVGRLGEWQFAAGYYLYLGSALGPGGLAARLRRHLVVEKRPFWHVDYLRCRSLVVAVWYAEEPVRHEHTWALAAGQLPGATIPVPRFGASDCRCPAHLIHFTCYSQPLSWFTGQANALSLTTCLME